jgi:hypothetical protein
MKIKNIEALNNQNFMNFFLGKNSVMLHMCDVSNDDKIKCFCGLSIKNTKKCMISHLKRSRHLNNYLQSMYIKQSLNEQQVCRFTSDILYDYKTIKKKLD